MSNDLDNVTLGDLARLPGRMDTLESRMDTLGDKMDALIEANKKALESFAKHSVRMDEKFDMIIELLREKEAV